MQSGPSWIRPVPNTLTVMRLLAAFVLPFAPTSWRLPLILFAGISDWADGVIARRFNVQSRFGILMDGVADKAFVFACVVTFVTSGEVPLWQGLLVMARDLTVAGIAAYAVARGGFAAFHHMEARRPGKITTALVIPWFVSLLIPGLEGVRPWLFWIGAIASVVAAIDYAIVFVEKAREINPQDPAAGR